MGELPRSLPAFGGTPRERATMARGLAFLFGTGASLVAVTLLLPHSSNTTDAPILAAVLAAYATMAVLLRWRESIPVRTLQTLLALGTSLISVCVVFGGDSASAYPLMYVWVGLYAAYVFSFRAAIVQTAWAATACALAFIVETDTQVPSVHWLMGTGTVVVAAVLTGHLTRRVRGQASDLAAVAEMANGLVDVSDFGPATCAGLRRSAGADVVVLFVPAADGSGLEASAVAGRADVARAFDVPAVRACVEEAHRTGNAQIVLQQPHPSGLRRLLGSVTGHAQPVLRDGRAAGVLALAWARPRLGVPDRACSAALLFAAEASVAMERAERLTRDRERRALDINDNIVQGLTVAKYAINQGHVAEGLRAIDDTLRRARQLITDQLTEAAFERGGLKPGDLVRRDPVPLESGALEP